jgi:hypothetical protein
MLFSAIGISITMLTLPAAFPFMLVVFRFASIMEVPFLSFSAFFVDRCESLWEFIGFHPYSDNFLPCTVSYRMFWFLGRGNVQLKKKNIMGTVEYDPQVGLSLSHTRARARTQNTSSWYRAYSVKHYLMYKKSSTMGLSVEM